MKWSNKSNKVFDDRLQKRLDIFLNKVFESYPDYKITYFSRDHKKLAERATEIRRLAGYLNNEDFFSDFGFEYIIQSKVKEENRITKQVLLKKLEKTHPEKISKISDIDEDLSDVSFYAKQENLTIIEFLEKHNLLRIESMYDVIDEIKREYPDGVKYVSDIDSKLVHRLAKYMKNEKETMKEKLINHSIIVDKSSIDFSKEVFFENATLSNDGKTILKYKNQSLIENLTIPKEITFIEEHAFANCKKILAIDFEQGSSLVSISDHAFSKCELVKKVDLSNATNLQNIGMNAFNRCISLQSIILSIDSLNNVGKNAIANCTSLKQVILNKKNEKVTILAQYFDISKLFVVTDVSFFNFLAYDQKAVVQNAKERTNIAISRLKNPVYLSEPYRSLYIYLLWNRILKSGNTDLFEEVQHLILNPDNAVKYRNSAHETELHEIVSRIDSFIETNKNDHHTLFKEVEVIEKAKLQVLVHFEDDSRYTYASLVMVDIGDKVFVSGKKKGIPGRVVEIEKRGSAPGFLEKVEQAYRKEAVDEGKNSVENIESKEVTNNPIVKDEYKVSIEKELEIIKQKPFEFVDYKDGLKLVKYSGSKIEIEIPRTFENKHVISIGEGAFYNNKKIRKVVLPETVVSMDPGVFEKCTALKTVVLSDGIKRLKNSTFGFCKSLTNVQLPSLLETIEDTCFFGCSRLEHIHLPKQLAYIGDGAFAKCEKLKTIDLPDSLLAIGMAAFYDCLALKEIKIPKEIKIIRMKLFTGCVNLKKVEIPNTITRIEDNAFAKCENLENIYLPDSLKWIGNWAFEGCSSIKEIHVPKSLTHFGKQVFWYCRSLTSLVIPNCVDTLYDKEFDGCSSIEKIVLPQSLESIGDFAFRSCSNLIEVDIPKSVRSIGMDAFQFCSRLKVLEIPPKVTIIEEGLCANCVKLEKVIIPKGVIRIKRSAFFRCKSLQSVELPNELEVIESTAFYKCYSLTHVYLPKSVKEMGTSVFSACYGIKEIKVAADNVYIGVKENLLLQVEEQHAVVLMQIGNTTINLNVPEYFNGMKVITIKKSAFEEKTKIKTIHLPETLKEIESFAFKGCTSISYLSIPDSVNYIGESAFEDCKSIKQVTLSKNLTEISGFLFHGCTKLKDITLHNKIREINEKSFADCTSLETLKLSEVTEYISNSAFNDCTSLKNVYLPKNMEISYYIFNSCPNIENVYFPLSIIELKVDNRIGKQFQLPFEVNVVEKTPNFKELFYVPLPSDVFPRNLSINETKSIARIIEKNINKMDYKSKTLSALYLLFSNHSSSAKKTAFEKIVCEGINQITYYFISSKQTSFLISLSHLKLINKNNFYDIFDDVFATLDIEDKKIILKIKEEILSL